MKDTDWRAEYVRVSDENSKLRQLLDAKGLESACNAGTLSGCEELLKASKLQIEEIKMTFALHSCPPEGRWCWLCAASERIEKVLSKKSTEGA